MKESYCEDPIDTAKSIKLSIKRAAYALAEFFKQETKFAYEIFLGPEKFKEAQARYQASPYTLENFADSVSKMNVEDVGELTGDLVLGWALQTKFANAVGPILEHAKVPTKPATSQVADITVNKSWQAAVGEDFANFMKLNDFAQDTRVKLKHAKLKNEIQNFIKTGNVSTIAKSSEIEQVTIITRVTPPSIYNCLNHANHPKRVGSSHPVDLLIVDSMLMPKEQAIALAEQFTKHTSLNISEARIRHIYEPDIVCFDKRLNVAGWHHDYLGMMQETGLFEFNITKTHKRGAYFAKWSYCGKPKRPGSTHFPNIWTHEQIMDKIFEAFYNQIEKPTNLGEKIVYLGKTSEDLKILISYDLKKIDISSIYPVID